MTSLPTWPSTNESFVPWVYLERNPKWDPCFDWSEDLVFWRELKTPPKKIEDTFIHPQQVPAGRASGLSSPPNQPSPSSSQKGTFTRALRLSKFQVGFVLPCVVCAWRHGLCLGRKRWNWWVRVSWWVGGLGCGRWWPLNIDFWGKKWGHKLECPTPDCPKAFGVDNHVIFLNKMNPGWMPDFMSVLGKKGSDNLLHKWYPPLPNKQRSYVEHPTFSTVSRACLVGIEQGVEV